MTLDKLVYAFADVQVELTPEFQPSSINSFLRSVPVNVYFQNEGKAHESKGYLVYDIEKQRFITALTDHLFPGRDWSTYLPSDLERYRSYQEIINQTFCVLHTLGVVREG